jgi:hypothetical protein
MQQLGFKLLNDISWVKPNPPPNLSCRYFTHATETIIWAARDKKSRHTFNYKLMKEINGRQCRMPICGDDMGLCYFHAEKYIHRMKAKEAGRRIAKFLNTDILTASDFNSALAALFSAAAMGYIKPKTTATVAYLAQIMVQTQHLAKQGFLEASTSPWTDVIRQSATQPEPAPNPAAPYPPEVLPPISAEPAAHPYPNPNPNSPLPSRRLCHHSRRKSCKPATAKVTNVNASESILPNLIQNASLHLEQDEHFQKTRGEGSPARLFSPHTNFWPHYRQPRSSARRRGRN